MSDDGSVVVLGDHGGVYLKVVDSHTGDETVSLSMLGRRVRSCAIDLARGILVSGSHNGELTVWDLGSGVELRKMRGHTGCVKSCRINCDGTRLVSTSDDCSAKVWSLDNGSLISSLDGHEGPVLGCGFSADKGMVFSVSQDCTLCVWNIETGAILSKFRARGPLHSCAADAETVLVTGWHGVYRLTLVP